MSEVSLDGSLRQNEVGDFDCDAFARGRFVVLVETEVDDFFDVGFVVGFDDRLLVVDDLFGDEIRVCT